jgi:hypothetical protein
MGAGCAARSAACPSRLVPPEMKVIYDSSKAQLADLNLSNHASDIVPTLISPNIIIHPLT